MPVEITFSTLLPAQPGYCVLEAIGEDAFPTQIHRDPIIAWAIESDSCAPYPVTLSGVQTGFAAIERPDGVVEKPCDAWYSSAAGWLRWMQEDYAEANQVDAAMLASWRANAEPNGNAPSQERQS